MWKTAVGVAIAIVGALFVVALFTRGKLPAFIDATKATKTTSGGAQ